MNKIKQCLFAALIAFSVLVVDGLYTFVSAQGQPLTFSAFGDIPYGSSEYALLQQQIADHNRYSPSAFIVHIGDIMMGSCDEKKYADVAGMMKGFAVPAYIVVGDNEYNDCGNPIQALAYWKKYFLNFEENFCGAPVTEHQSVRPENLAFVFDGVLFIGINLVGGDVHDLNEWSIRMQDDADWVNQQFQAKVSQVRAAVVFAHAGPEGSANNRGPFLNQFRPAAATFGKPVLYIQGNSHSYKLAQPWPEKNITQLVVPKGNAEPPLEVTVTMDSNPQSAFIVKRNPWSSQTIVNMPPCANAGPDQTLTGTTVANLAGQATDDGDPSGALTTTWSKASGPGTVTFGNASALATTASFSAPGIYVLRLTANDGQLQKTDEVTIAVNAALPSAPIVGSFTPASGAAGTVVTLDGSDFAGATNVDFNGTPVTSFTVNSNTQITATVPTGATTGKITVTTAAGSGASANDFVVIPDGGGSPSVLTFHPTDDAYVQTVSTTSNFGSLPNLRVETNSAFDVSISYLKFNVTGVTGAVRSAKVRLKVTDGSTEGGSIFTVSNNYWNTNNPWVETGLIWDNAPELDGSALSSLGPVTSGQTVELEVTAPLVRGNGIYSFALKSNNSNAAEYSSKEGVASPELVVEVSQNAPTIVSFSPASGVVGTEVTITGTKFNGATAAAFNGTPAAFNIDSDTQIRAAVPAGATSGKISVSNPDGTAYSETDFAVTAPPEIISFAPSSGVEGTEVTITGSHFTGATGVSFNGNAATAFSVDSDSQIRAYVPAGATPGTGKIVVTHALGNATSAADFTITTATPLTFSFAPQHDAYVNSGSPTSTSGTSNTLRAKVGVYNSYLKFEVTGLSGTLQSAKLRLHVSDASPDGGSVYVTSNNYKSSTTPWVEKGLNWNNAPDLDGAALSSAPQSGVILGQWVEFDVTAAIVGNGVYSFGLKSNNSDKVYYRSKEYGAATTPQLVIQGFSSGAPSITSFAPSSGPVGTEVTIMGNNFSGTTAVTFNGVPSTNFTVDSNTKIRAKVPAGATMGRIQITNASGSGSFAQEFVVTAPPQMTSFSPASGIAGTEVTIIGQNFTGTTGVSFKGIAAASIFVDSDTQIRAIVPANAAPGTGKIVVTNSAGSVTSANDFTVNLIFTFAPQHDVYVSSAAPTTNYGKASTFRAKLGSTETFFSYLKFEVTGLSGTLLSAKLRFYVSDASPDGGSVYVVSNNYLDGSAPWVETGMFWGNAPSINGTVLSSTGKVSVGQWVEFDVTPAIAGDGIYSFGLKNNNSDKVYYRSKENGASTMPQLVILAASSSSSTSKRDYSDTSKDENVVAAIPAEFVLHQNYPNPFNPNTQIRFGLPRESHVTIKLYTINGVEVKTLVNDHYPAGTHTITFHAKNLTSGTYLYVMQASSVRQVRRLVLMK